MGMRLFFFCFSTTSYLLTGPPPARGGATWPQLGGHAVTVFRGAASRIISLDCCRENWPSYGFSVTLDPSSLRVDGRRAQNSRRPIDAKPPSRRRGQSARLDKRSRRWRTSGSSEGASMRRPRRKSPTDCGCVSVESRQRGRLGRSPKARAFAAVRGSLQRRLVLRDSNEARESTAKSRVSNRPAQSRRTEEVKIEIAARRRTKARARDLAVPRALDPLY